MSVIERGVYTSALHIVNTTALHNIIIGSVDSKSSDTSKQTSTGVLILFFVVFFNYLNNKNDIPDGTGQAINQVTLVKHNTTQVFIVTLHIRTDKSNGLFNRKLW